jgi:hypothetical protein
LSASHLRPDEVRRRTLRELSRIVDCYGILADRSSRHSCARSLILRRFRKISQTQTQYPDQVASMFRVMVRIPVSNIELRADLRGLEWLTASLAHAIQVQKQAAFGCSRRRFLRLSVRVSRLNRECRHGSVNSQLASRRTREVRNSLNVFGGDRLTNCTPVRARFERDSSSLV